MDNNLQKSSARGEVLLKYFYDYNEKQEKLDIVKLANFFGFIVEEESLSDGVQAKMIVSESKNILVNNGLEIEYKRYTIAYELSYYFIYYKGERKPFKHINISDEDEIVKDLAISLLVKNDDFYNCYTSLKGEYSESKLIEYLKEQFGIPFEIVRVKIEEIKKHIPVMIKSKI